MSRKECSDSKTFLASVYKFLRTIVIEDFKDTLSVYKTYFKFWNTLLLAFQSIK